ncbi:hypothetical protein LEN26_014581 [Aphanomyces euteiches]|nr:hypothetical protein LEN26_014581 [Aphanomyces euteiches]
MMSYTDRRRDAARTGMAKLRAARKIEMEILMTQEQSLQVALQYLKAHPEEQHRGITPFAYTHRVLRQRHNNALREQVESRYRLIQSLCGWRIPQQLYAGYVEVPSRMTLEAYNLSLEAERFSSKETQVDDDTQVKVHLGQDGSCIQAIESHLQFTIFANFENVAKTWWFDLLESTPLVRSTIVESFDRRVLYVRQEYPQLKYNRMCVAGVFLDEEKDRITITQTGIALGDRFPFQEGESRTAGFHWVVFHHVTDHVTPCHTGSLSLREVAQNLRCTLTPNDSDEAIYLKIQNAAQRALDNFHDLFRQRCDRFKLEPFHIRSRNFSFEEHS